MKDKDNYTRDGVYVKTQKNTDKWNIASGDKDTISRAFWLIHHQSHQDATDNRLIGLEIFPWENDTLKSFALEMKLLGGANMAWRGTIASLGTKVLSFFSLRTKWSYLHFAVGTPMSICRILKRKLKTLAEKVVVVTVTHSTYPGKYQTNCFNPGKKKM